MPRKRHPGSPTSSSRPTGGATAVSGTSASQSDKKVPRQHPHSPVGAVGGPHTAHASEMRLEPTRDVTVRERGPIFSVASYVDMLDFMSDSSQSDPGETLSRSTDSDPLTPQPSRVAAPAPTFSNKVPRKVSPVERVRPQARPRGYNYGVPSNTSGDSVKPKMRASGRLPRDEKIRVCVRKRPLSRRETRAADPDIVEAGSTTTVVVKESKVSVDLTAFTMKVGSLQINCYQNVVVCVKMLKICCI